MIIRPSERTKVLLFLLPKGYTDFLSGKAAKKIQIFQEKNYISRTSRFVTQFTRAESRKENRKITTPAAME